MKTILTVCVGNICRSPMAEALLARALPRMSVRSAGIGALIGMPADPIAQSLMANLDIDIGAHRARQIDLAMCESADIILVMDLAQRRHIEERYPVARGKVFRIAEADKQDVPDPYKRPRSAFEHALYYIDAGVRSWAQKIPRIQ